MIAWIHQYRPRSAWYELSDEVRSQLEERWATCAERATAQGASRIGQFSIRGQSLFERLELWTFPSAAAAEALWSDLMAHGYADYRETANLLAVDAAFAGRTS